ncbi:MAG: CPBP family intramembrane metalloprotease [bacterium]
MSKPGEQDSKQPAFKEARLPAFFVFFLAFLPIIVLLFEFDPAPRVFSGYQLAAGGLLVLVIVFSRLCGHDGSGKAVGAVFAFLMIPPIASWLFISLVAAPALLSPSIVYYIANYTGITAEWLYLNKSGFKHADLFIGRPAWRASWIYAAGFAFVSWGAMAIFFSASGRQMTAFASPDPAFSIALAAVFSLFNGAMEELWFRSLILGAFARVFPGGFAVIYQSILFGVIHFEGTPSGPAGIALASIFGLAAGWLTLKARSVLPAVCLHISVDFFIGLYF